jgi:hypothetical protein
MEQRQPVSTLKSLSCRKYSFQKLTQFSEGNNVLDAPASNTNGFLLRDASVSSTQLHRPIWNKDIAHLYLEKLTLQEIFLSESNSILRKTCARFTCF